MPGGSFEIGAVSRSEKANSLLAHAPCHAVQCLLHLLRQEALRSQKGLEWGPGVDSDAQRTQAAASSHRHHLFENTLTQALEQWILKSLETIRMSPGVNKANSLDCLCYVVTGGLNTSLC